jgi:hypothetical protein
MERTEALTSQSGPRAAVGGSYVDWSAVLAGAATAAAIAVLSSTFGAAIGLSAVSLEPGQGSVTLAMVLGAVWLVVTLVASYAAGGYIAGRMRRRVDQATADEVSVHDGLNGLAVWAVGTLVGVMLLTNAAGNVVSAAGSAASTAVTAAGTAIGGAAQGALSAAGAALPQDAGANAMSFVTDTLLRTTPNATKPAAPGETSRQTAGIFANYLTTGEVSDADRAYLEAAVAAETGLTPAEVTTRVVAALATAEAQRTEAAKLVEDAKQQAIEIAETARISAVLTAFLLTAAALVAAAAACVAAVRGGLHRDEGRVFAGFSYRR